MAFPCCLTDCLKFFGFSLPQCVQNQWPDDVHTHEQVSAKIFSYAILLNTHFPSDVRRKFICHFAALYLFRINVICIYVPTAYIFEHFCGLYVIW